MSERLLSLSMDKSEEEVDGEFQSIVDNFYAEGRHVLPPFGVEDGLMTEVDFRDRTSLTSSVHRETWCIREGYSKKDDSAKDD